jgi:hypothetical protein
MTTADTSDASPGGVIAETAAAMRRLVVDGEFPAGARITERQVSDRFGCTAATAREVFHILEKAGAITQSARRGARVVDQTAAPPDDVFVVWRHLSRLIWSETAAASATPPPWSPPSSSSRSRRLEAIEHRLGTMAGLTNSPRLGQILGRLAMHLAIVAPDRLAEAEASLVR